jgi:RNA polymerase sigma factor (sigma-70 family)
MRENRTEIIIETDRVLVIRRPASVILVWCEACGHMSKMGTPEEVVTMTGVSSRAIYCAIEAGRVHFNETAEGLLLVCFDSLGIIDENQSATARATRSSAAQPQLQVTRRASRKQNRESLPSAERLLTSSEIPADTSAEGDAEGRSSSRKKDWTLTAEAFDSLLTWLDADRACAGLRYENIRAKLIKYFDYRGCLQPDDLADETINRVARRILDGKEIWASDPANYFYGVARNLVREYWGSPERDFSAVGCLPAPAHPFEDTIKTKAIEQERWLMEKQLELLEECMQKLSVENRELIITYYQGERGDKIRNRKEMAERLGIPPNALRIRVYRIREKLEKYVMESLNQMPHAK